ncbi:MAG: DUF4258 domain-containing protein [Deltaproteobacteria bacterium]|nr:MAG: DUF4258 domain-containing protein [Deltaproteobacteria bacterium]
MIDIAWIKKSIREGDYLLTLHAEEERRSDHLSIDDVEYVLLHGEILENYPEDQRGASCLVSGHVLGKSVHVVCGKNKLGKLIVITVYIPTPPKWETPTKRRKK